MLVSFNSHYGHPTASEGRGEPVNLVERASKGSASPTCWSCRRVRRPAARRGAGTETSSAEARRRTGTASRWAGVTHDPWALGAQAEARGEGTFGLAVLSRLPATRRRQAPGRDRPGDPVRDRRVLHVEVDVDGNAVDLVGVHLTSRLPHGPPLQLTPAAPAAPATRPAGDRRRRLQLLGPGRGARCCRAGNGGARPHVARAPAAQPDRPHPRAPDTIDVSTARCSPDVGSDHRPVRAVLRNRLEPRHG